MTIETLLSGLSTSEKLDAMDIRQKAELGAIFWILSPPIWRRLS